MYAPEPACACHLGTDVQPLPTLAAIIFLYPGAIISTNTDMATWFRALTRQPEKLGLSSALVRQMLTTGIQMGHIAMYAQVWGSCFTAEAKQCGVDECVQFYAEVLWSGSCAQQS